MHAVPSRQHKSGFTLHLHYPPIFSISLHLPTFHSSFFYHGHKNEDEWGFEARRHYTRPWHGSLFALAPDFFPKTWALFLISLEFYWPHVRPWEAPIAGGAVPWGTPIVQRFTPIDTHRRRSCSIRDAQGRNFRSCLLVSPFIGGAAPWRSPIA